MIRFHKRLSILVIYLFILYQVGPLPEMFDNPACELTEGPHENNKLIMR